MRIFTLIGCYCLIFPAFAIYDLASIDITPSSQGTKFCFTLDTSKKELYLALTTDEKEFLFLSPTPTGKLSSTPWQFPAEPPVFLNTRKPACYGPFSTETLQGIRLYAGVGDSFNELIEQQHYLKIFDHLPPLTKEEKSWTVMVYIIGSSLERKGSKTVGNASKDILEMLAGTQLLENKNINVVITTGGSSRDGWKTVKRSLIRDGQLFVLEDLGEQLMSQPQTLSDFVLWTKEQFPAQHHALILWNHGGGTQGFGQDTSKNINASMMSLTELHQAYQAIRDGLKKPLELVIYDACMMGSIEVAEITATVADAMASSVETEPAHGIDYTHLLNQLAIESPTEGITVGKIAQTGYIQQTKNQKTFETSQITYSIFDLTQLPTVRDSFARFTEELHLRFDDETFLSYESLSQGIIRAPGYPLKETGKLRSLDEKKNIRIDLYTVLGTVSPEFPQLKSFAEELRDQLRQLVVSYEVNDRIKKIDPEAGRISLDIGSEKSYLTVLPSAYRQLNQALEVYNQKRNSDTSKPTGSFTCPGGITCADAKWWELQSNEVTNINGYYGQQADQGMKVHLIKPLYRYQRLTENLEIGVNGHEACQYQLCTSETECSDITVTEDQGLWLADVVYNETPAVLTLCQDDNANWKACSVLPQTEGIWGRDETLSAGDTLTPMVLHLHNQELTQQHSESLLMGETMPVIKKVCDVQTAMIAANYSGSNQKPQFEKLCNKGDCVCKENDENESCIATANQFRAGVRIEVF